jgi:hypothetical protein
MTVSDRLYVKNWTRFQHYHKKTTPLQWIKLHRELLDDPEFGSLSPSRRYQLIAIWLLASVSNGSVPNDNAFVARRIGVSRVDLAAFLHQGWLQTDAPNGLPEPFEEVPF